MKKLSISTVVMLVVVGCTTLVAMRWLSVEASASADSTLVKNGTKSPRQKDFALMFTLTPSYSAQAWIRGGERFPRGGSIVVKSAIESRALVADFSAAVDPSLNFDGKSALFAGKRNSGDPWQVYEVVLGKGAPRRVTSGEEDCVRPMYLPDGRIVYAHKTGGRFVLEVAALDGSGTPLRLTYAPGNFLPTAVLQDGRVLFESSFPLGSGGPPEIYAVYPDGSGVEAYRCDHGHGRSNAVQAANGDVLFSSMHGLGRFTSSLAHEVTVNVPERDYTGGIAETETGDLVLSSRTVRSRGAAANESTTEQPFVLKVWGHGSHELTTLFEVPGESLVEPVIVAPRRVANRFPTALHDWKTTNLLALNSYISRDTGMPLAALALVRVSTVDESGRVKVLGTAPVEKDGSFFVQAPGDSPLKFELLNAQGNVVRKENGWMWARSGEQRICVGCHAGPEHAPDNAVPAVLLRSTTPADLTGAPAETVKGGN